MKPNEQNLERLLKRLIKQQIPSSAELLFHWKGLSKRGDRVVINTLTKQNGWEVFAFWSESEPEIRAKLQEISEKAGISEEGVLVLKSAGFISADADSPRSRSLWILQTVRNGVSQEWERAADLTLADHDFFEGTLSLLELEDTTETARFLTTLLERRPSREQDPAIRRMLYKLRQKGIEAPQEEKVVTTAPLETRRSEFFLFAENRLPLWQPFFYYRSSGSRGDWFFAEINEGKVFEIVQQQRDIRINQKRMQSIADNYAQAFQKDTAIPLSFIQVPPTHARFFLEESFGLVRGSEDFTKYMGDAPTEDPLSEIRLREQLVAADAAALLSHEYFQLWVAEDEFLDHVFVTLAQIQEGPIILPEPQRRQRETETMDLALKKYFSGEKGRVWALALKKAAYFLNGSDPEMAAMSLGFARRLLDPQATITSDPFVAVIVERSLEIRKRQMARQQTEEKRSSLIMTPQEFERSMKKGS